ncbi:MAG: MCE family protein [Opitutaceae bacterium]|nr:MCE family protein [Opitutaceae bacterium]
MKKKLSPTVVGAFVAGAIVLGLAALVSFGSGRLFNKPARFVIELRQTSISGLEPGAPVKFSGVRVGRVQGVDARVDPEAAQVVVRVDCTIDEAAAAAMLPPPAPAPDEIMARLVAGGMSAKLNFSGITGLLYIDLVVTPARRGQTVAYDQQTGAAIVPAEASVLEELTETLTTIATNFSRIDFPGISADLRKVLGDLDAALADLDVRGTLGRINAAADSIGSLANDPNLRASLEKMNRSMETLDALLVDLRAEVPTIRGDLQKALAEAVTAMREVAGTATQAQDLLKARGGLGGEIATTLEALRRAAGSAEQLLEYLERNPTALLRGRAEDAPEPRK